jgi:hypothetical protein
MPSAQLSRSPSWLRPPYSPDEIRQKPLRQTNERIGLQDFERANQMFSPGL